MSSDLIDDVLNQNPQITTVDEAIAECEKRGVKVSVWPVYFAGQRMGRKLGRRNVVVDHAGEVQSLVEELLNEVRGDKTKAVNCVNHVRDNNGAGYLDEYQRCIAEDLIEVAGGIPSAVEAIKRFNRN